MSTKAAAPEFCDKCSQQIGSDCVVVIGIDDKRGLAMPARLQSRAFCGASCFFAWCEEIKPARVPAPDEFTEP